MGWVADEASSAGVAPFCPISDGAHCCSADMDELLAARFEVLGVDADLYPDCAARVHSLLCEVGNAHLFSPLPPLFEPEGVALR